MRAMIDNEKLTVPPSLTGVHKRERVLQREIDRIDKQLTDKDRVDTYPNRGAYIHWRQSANRARVAFHQELELLRVWMSSPTQTLFRRAYELLKRLQEEDCDFDASEQGLITELDRYFNPRERNGNEQADQ